jgi:hypothetical protein
LTEGATLQQVIEKLYDFRNLLESTGSKEPLPESHPVIQAIKFLEASKLEKVTPEGARVLNEAVERLDGLWARLEREACDNIMDGANPIRLKGEIVGVIQARAEINAMAREAEG